MAIITTSGNISALLNLNNNSLQPAADRLQDHLYNFVYSLDELSMALVYGEYNEFEFTPNLLKAYVWYPEWAEITAKGSGFFGNSGKVSQILYNGNTYNWDITGNGSWSLNKGLYSGTISSITLWNESNTERFTLKGGFSFNDNGISGTLSSSSIQYNGLQYEQVGSIKLSTEPSGKLSSFSYKDAQGSLKITGSFSVNQADITDTLGGLFDQASLFSGNDTFNVSDNSRAWFGFAGNDVMYGGDLEDELHGGSGNDLLDGGAGSDFMYGGSGNDTYIVDNIDDVVTEEINEGTDTVKSSISHDLANNVENLILTGDGSTNGTGNNLANTITGNAGNNILDGGTGIDKLAGGAGDDTYIVDLITKGKGTAAATLVLEDSITEKAGEGDDTLRLRIKDSALAQIKTDLEKANKTTTVTLAANLEKLDASATGNIALNLTGHKTSQSLTGNAGNNILDAKGGAATLSGLAGDDIYVVYSADDLGRIREDADQGEDTLQIAFKSTAAKGERTTIDLSGVENIENINVTGTGLFELIGNAEDNRLSGNNSGTLMAGGAGNDTYVLNHKDDVIAEAFDGGNDTIETSKFSIDLTLPKFTNVENVTLTGKTALNATGNELENTLIGNDGNNILDGGRNDDISFDTLRGGKGNDTYILNNVGDVVVEEAKEGIDTIKTEWLNIDLTDYANVENITLTGALNLNATGDGQANILTGNSGNNKLDGGKGVDKLIGGAGDDEYTVDLIIKGKGKTASLALEDTITEKAKEGDDTLNLRISDEDLVQVKEALELASKTTTITLAATLEHLDASETGDIALNLTGNAGNNIIVGNAGDNIIIGGAGADTMTGGDGADTFKFTSLKDLGLGEDKQDVIEDFSRTEGDKIDFSALKGYTWLDQDSGSIGSAAKQLWWELSDDGKYVTLYGSTDKDAEAEFSIKLVGITDLAKEDFIGLI